MIEGWISLHRKLLENPIIKKEGLLQLFIYCLLKANSSDSKIIHNSEEILIKRGSFISSRKHIASDLNQKESTIYKRLKILKKLEICNTKSNNKYTLLTVINYDSYQNPKQESHRKRNNKVTTKEQQSNTNNKDNNNNKENNNTNTREKINIFKNSVLQFKNKYPETMLYEFINYWTEKSKSGIMRYENEKFFEISKRLATWYKNQKSFKKTNNQNNEYEENSFEGFTEISKENRERMQKIYNKQINKLTDKLTINV